MIFDYASLVLSPPNDIEDMNEFKRTGVLAEMESFFTEPRLSHVFRVGGSRIGVVIIACPWTVAFSDRRRLTQAAADGAEWAAERGAQCVSMTGTIPAASNGGVDIANELERRQTRQRFPHFIGVTHGHETVAAAFMLNVDHALKSSRRRIENECVAFIGLGHIGKSILYLFLECGHRPRNLMLVDVESKRDLLFQLRNNVIERYDVQTVTIALSTATALPDIVYKEATLIAGSVSTANVLNVDCLCPGCIVVDDSFPPIVDVRAVRRRTQAKGDLLFAVAGALEGRASKDEITTDPKLRLDRMISPTPSFATAFVEMSIRAQSVSRCAMTGCVFSSLLNGRYGLGLEVGQTRPENVLRRYRALTRMQYGGTHFYVFDTHHASRDGTQTGVLTFDDDYVYRFAEKFGETLSAKL